MNLEQMNSIAAPGSSAADTVAHALSGKGGVVKGRATPSQASGASSAGAASSAATSSSDITANDFLTLLVSELKNQDPTQPTDPNAYISQLVGVNSLQQLISINQGLTSFETSAPASTSPTSGAAGGTAGQ